MVDRCTRPNSFQCLVRRTVGDISRDRSLFRPQCHPDGCFRFRFLRFPSGESDRHPHREEFTLSSQVGQFIASAVIKARGRKAGLLLVSAMSSNRGRLRLIL